MKKNLSLALLFSLGFLVAPAIAAQSAVECLSVYKDDDKTYFKNNCHQQITVAWCSLTTAVNGKKCGDGGTSWNRFYTQMTNLDSGEQKYRWKVGDIRFAACRGYINSWNAKGKFTSDLQGHFACQD